MEEWRDIKDYEGKYQVSNLGNVKSLNYRHTGKEKIRRPRKNGCGYLIVDLWKNRKQTTYTIHRLVLSTFAPCENMENLQVNHIDEDKSNNRLENLEWVTHKDNQNHGTRNKRISEKKINGKKSIQVVQLTIDGKLVNVWKSAHDAKREGSFDPGAIIQCCKNKYLRDGNNIYKGFRWCYLYSYISKIDPRIKKVILFDKEYYVNN